MLICCAIAVSTANAQTENYFGPKKGDFAITIGAEPVINFVGNMFNGNTNNRLSGIGGSLAGKYFFGDRFAVTAGIGTKNSKSTSFNYHPEDEDYKSISKYDTDDRGVTNEEIDTNNYNKTTKKVTELATGIMNGNVAFNFYF